MKKSIEKAFDTEIARKQLLEMLKPGDTVYTVLRHVSRSGMSRGIDCYIIRENQPRWISSYVGNAIGQPQSQKAWEQSRGLTVSGCGMDMGFHLVHCLSRALYKEDYALKQEWI